MGKAQSLSSINSTGKTLRYTVLGEPRAKESQHTLVNAEGLKMERKTKNLLENTGGKLLDIDLGNVYLKFFSYCRHLSL